MLIEFSVGNYLSFKEKVTFSMVATDLGVKTKLDENNVFQVNDELSLLKSAAVYGANASGKSNLFKAISFMDEFIRKSSKDTQVTDYINVEEFRLNTETVGNPSSFEIVFLLNKKIYRYGFEVNRREVVSEWLFYTPTRTEYQLFTRERQKFDVNGRFKEGSDLQNKTRSNALFISVVAQFNGKLSQQILFWFEQLATVSGAKGHLSHGHTARLLSDKNYKNEIIQFIQKLDLNINDIRVQEENVPSDHIIRELIEKLSKNVRAGEPEREIIEFEIRTMHKKYDSDGNFVGKEEFELNSNESEGTRKLFAFAAPIITSLKEGRVLFIDELDARLHPLITQSIIKLFNSKDTNAKNAQLIFITHDTNLLTNKIFRRDQIWFVEKDQYEATDLYSLVEYDISDDASFKSDYIKGKYGAIPYIGNLKDLIV